MLAQSHNSAGHQQPPLQLGRVSMALVPREAIPSSQTSHRAWRGCLAATHRSGHIQTTLSAKFILGAAQDEATLQVLYSPQHSLIILSFQGCPSPDVHTSHLTCGHSLGCSSCPPFSLAILPSGEEEVSQVLCKIMTFFNLMEKETHLSTPSYPESCYPAQPHRLERFPMR